MLQSYGLFCIGIVLFLSGDDQVPGLALLYLPSLVALVAYAFCKVIDFPVCTTMLCFLDVISGVPVVRFLSRLTAQGVLSMLFLYKALVAFNHHNCFTLGLW